MTLPSWLIKKTPKQKNIRKITELLGKRNFFTVCESAKCPNIGECFSCQTMTFMILGDKCTRNCKFCAVEKKLDPCSLTLDPSEPFNVAQAAKKLNLKYVVVTSVTRDDLKDGGASQFAKTILEIKQEIPEVKIEVLIPDFQGNTKALETVLKAEPYVLNHNVETIERLYSQVRPEANYEQSLQVLKKSKQINKNIYTKSGFMVGLGEKFEEVIEVLKDLRSVDCDIVTIGQYLSPSKKHFPVAEYIHPDIFKAYEEKAYQLGFKFVASGPFVRSSYRAHEIGRIIN